MSEIIRAEIEIQVDSKEQLRKDIARCYSCEESEVTGDMIYEYLNDHIEAHSTIKNVFRIIGGDTDGWILSSID